MEYKGKYCHQNSVKTKQKQKNNSNLPLSIFVKIILSNLYVFLLIFDIDRNNIHNCFEILTKSFRELPRPTCLKLTAPPEFQHNWNVKLSLILVLTSKLKVQGVTWVKSIYYKVKWNLKSLTRGQLANIVWRTPENRWAVMSLPEPFDTVMSFSGDSIKQNCRPLTWIKTGGSCCLNHIPQMQY